MNPHYCKGLVEGLGLETQKVGRYRVLSPGDYRRLERWVTARRPHAVPVGG